MVGHLIDFYRFHLTETYQLVTETMPLVQQPKAFACYIGSTDHLMLEQRFLARYIPEECFIEKSFFFQEGILQFACYDCGIKFSGMQRLLNILCFISVTRMSSSGCFSIS